MQRTHGGNVITILGKRFLWAAVMLNTPCLDASMKAIWRQLTYLFIILNPVANIPGEYIIQTRKNIICFIFFWTPTTTTNATLKVDGNNKLQNYNFMYNIIYIGENMYQINRLSLVERTTTEIIESSTKEYKNKSLEVYT